MVYYSNCAFSVCLSTAFLFVNIACDRICVTDTSRLPFSDEEENEGNYIFVTYESMLADIAMHAYLEYGSYEGALYGTKLDTIRQIQADGLIAVIDIEPQVTVRSVLYFRLEVEF